MKKSVRFFPILDEATFRHHVVDIERHVFTFRRRHYELDTPPNVNKIPNMDMEWGVSKEEGTKSDKRKVASLQKHKRNVTVRIFCIICSFPGMWETEAAHNSATTLY